MKPPPPAPETLPPIAPFARARSNSSSSRGLLTAEAVAFFDSHDRFRMAAICSMSPSISARIIEWASAFSLCIASTARSAGLLMREVCWSMIAAESRERPEKQVTSEVSSSAMIRRCTRNGLTTTRLSEKNSMKFGPPNVAAYWSWRPPDRARSTRSIS